MRERKKIAKTPLPNLANVIGLPTDIDLHDNTETKAPDLNAFGPETEALSDLTEVVSERGKKVSKHTHWLKVSVFLMSLS